MKKKGYEIGSRNVFKDIGVPNAEEHFVKAQLVFKIDTLMKERKLKQVDAADLFGVRQPDVSTMLRGEFRQFSVERLLRFLVALNQDVEIVVRPHRDAKNAPVLHVSSRAIIESRHPQTARAEEESASRSSRRKMADGLMTARCCGRPSIIE